MSKYKLYFKKYYLDYIHGYKIHVFAIIIILLITPNHLYCANNSQVDSLLKVLDNCKEDSSRIKIYKELGNHYKRQSPDTSSIYFKEALSLAKKNDWKTLTGLFHMELGENCLDMGLFEESEEHLKLSKEIFTRFKNDRELAKILGFEGNICWKRGDFNDAISFFLEALKISEALGDKEQIAQMCNDIGIIYCESSEYNKSLRYYLKSYELRKKLNDKKGIAQSLNNIGIIHYYKGNKQKTLEYYLKCLKIAQEINYKALINIVESNLGEIYAELGDYKKSEIHYKRGFQAAVEIKNFEGQALILEQMATSFIVQKKYNQSVKYANEGLKIAKDKKFLFIEKRAYENLSNAHKGLNNYKEAYTYYKLFKYLNDSVFNETSSKQIIEMQTKYDTDKKESENELLRKGNELQQMKINKETNFRNFLIVVTVLILLLSLILYFKVRDKKKNEIILENKVKTRTQELEKAKDRAEENDRLKTAFLANISHEIRTPMNGIMGFSQLIKRPRLTVEKQKEYISKIEKSGERMLTIVNNLVEISKIESNQMELTISPVNVNEEISSLYKKFEEEAKLKGLDFIFMYPPSSKPVIIETDHSKLNAVLQNLINNAIKFTISGSVTFGFEVLGENIEFYVKDTGIGIGDDVKDVVFERFIQADLAAEKQYDGAGLGLSISKAYVEMLGGKIWVESEYWQGSSFYFSLPLTKNSIEIENDLAANNKIPQRV